MASKPQNTYRPSFQDAAERKYASRFSAAEIMRMLIIGLESGYSKKDTKYLIAQLGKRMGHAEHAQSSARKYAERLCEELGLNADKSIIDADLKDPVRVLQKAITQYNGDLSRVDDTTRMRIEFDDPKMIPFIQRQFSKRRNCFQRMVEATKSTRSISLTKKKDFFESPRRSNYAGMILKLATKTGRGTKLKFEVQISHKGMEKDVYPETHRLYEGIRAEIEHFEAQGITIDQAIRKKLFLPETIETYEEIIRLHQEGLKRYGLMPYIGDTWDLHLTRKQEKEYQRKHSDDDLEGVVPLNNYEDLEPWEREVQASLDLWREEFDEKPTELNN